MESLFEKFQQKLLYTPLEFVRSAMRVRWSD